ncbi:MAG: dehydrogenase, partial [Nitriliruptor sp.]
MSSQRRILVVNVSLSSSARDYDETVTFLQRPFRLVRVGTDGDLDAAARLVVSWASEADAIALTGLREAQALGLYDGHLDGLERVRGASSDVPVVDGRTLHDVLQEWAIRHVDQEMPGFFSNARTVVLGGLNHDRTTRVLKEFTQNLQFADPLLRMDIPATLDANPVLGLAVKTASRPYNLVPEPLRATFRSPGQRLSHALARQAARECDVVVATYEELIGFGLEDLAGKTLISSSISDERLAELGSRGVDMVLDTTPQPFDVTVNAGVLEAMMVALGPEDEKLTNDDLLEMIVSAGLESRTLYPNGPKRKSRFAFVIHPLSQEYF